MPKLHETGFPDCKWAEGPDYYDTASPLVTLHGVQVEMRCALVTSKNGEEVEWVLLGGGSMLTLR